MSKRNIQKKIEEEEEEEGDEKDEKKKLIRFSKLTCNLSWRLVIRKSNQWEFDPALPEEIVEGGTRDYYTFITQCSRLQIAKVKERHNNFAFLYSWNFIWKGKIIKFKICVQFFFFFLRKLLNWGKLIPPFFLTLWPEFFV